MDIAREYGYSLLELQDMPSEKHLVQGCQTAGPWVGCVTRKSCPPHCCHWGESFDML